MARKTKAETLAEQESLNARRMLAEAEAYPARLMAALEEATTKNNYELEVRNGMFSLRDRDQRDSTLNLPMTHTRDNQDVLESLEWDLQSKAMDRAEEARRYQVKQAALAKLTAEERELLSL